MKQIFPALVSMVMAASASSAPEPAPQLRAAVAKWAAPASVTRFQFAMVDLNEDGHLDAVVHVTDSAYCGNGGCPLLVFEATSNGYEKVGDSGVVRRPIYLLKEVNLGWTSLAAIVGLGEGAGIRPIRYMGTEYRSDPIMRAHMELTSQNYQYVLDLEEAP